VDNLAHGSLTKTMSDLGLNPQNKASQISSSVEELRKKLIKIRVNVLPSHSLLIDHSKCHWVRIEKMNEQVIMDTPSPTLQMHRQHMENAQTTLVGIDAEWRDEEEETDDFERC
jgi:hypothetical protein